MRPGLHYRLNRFVGDLPSIILFFYLIWGAHQIFATEEASNLSFFNFVNAVENEWLQFLCWVIPGVIVTILFQTIIRNLFRYHFVATCPTCSKPLMVSTKTEREGRSRALALLSEGVNRRIGYLNGFPNFRKTIPLFDFFLAPTEGLFTFYTCQECGYRKFFKVESNHSTE